MGTVGLWDTPGLHILVVFPLSLLRWPWFQSLLLFLVQSQCPPQQPLAVCYSQLCGTAWAAPCFCWGCSCRLHSGPRFYGSKDYRQFRGLLVTIFLVLRRCVTAVRSLEYLSQSQARLLQSSVGTGAPYPRHPIMSSLFPKKRKSEERVHLSTCRPLWLCQHRCPAGQSASLQCSVSWAQCGAAGGTRGAEEQQAWIRAGCGSSAVHPSRARYGHSARTAGCWRHPQPPASLRCGCWRRR